MTKRWLAPIVLGTCVVAVFTASAGGARAKSGGTFKLGTSSTIDSLNPYVAFNQDAYSMFEYIYPFLVQYDRSNHNFAQDFATSWKASNGGKTWTFKTRANAKWSDGKPLTARDAAWTINTDIKYQGGGAANAAGLIAHIKRADAPNATTLVVHYTAAPGNVLGQFQQFAILPQHVWSAHLGKNGAGLKTFANNAPVVSGGPFKLVKFTKNEIALFERNNSFFGPKPHVDGFGLRMFANDDAMVSAMKAHEIDAIESVPSTAIKTLKNAGFQISDVPGLDQTDFIINSNPKKKKNRELLNLKVKEAFAHAVDRAHIIRVVFLGRARPANSIVPATTGPWHDPSLQPEKFDLKLANKLLDNVGYKRGAGGIRMANGHKMSYDVVAPTGVTSVPRTFQILQADFKKIGVQLRQKALDDTAAFDAMSGPNNTYQGFDLALWDWVSLIDPDFMLSVVTCAQYGGWSDSGYCNKTYDRMYSQQQLTPDQGKRQQIVRKMQRYLYTQRPYVWIATEDAVSALSSKWKGWVSSPQGPFNALSKLSLTNVQQK
ncbi:MAG: ABC transporter substrate-binding protein [Gaiellaceae bacterium]|jgi:peptide/nickel transport system substrate-binding protein|nr:peptide ABC transporter substrate-binding protein [Acidobacteriota bacterium]